MQDQRRSRANAERGSVEPRGRLLFVVLGLWRWPAARGLAIRRRRTTLRYRRRSRTSTSLTEVIQKHPTTRRPTICAARSMARPARTERRSPISTRPSASIPNYAQAYANRGLLNRQTGKFDLALADYNKALSIDANYAAGLSRPRHRSIAQQGHSAQALGDFNKAIALRPDNARPITIAACFIRASVSISSRSTISPPRSGSRRRKPISTWRARSAIWPERPQIGGERSRSGRAAQPQNVQAWASRGLAYERLGAKGQSGRLLCEGAQHQ